MANITIEIESLLHEVTRYGHVYDLCVIDRANEEQELYVDDSHVDYQKHLLSKTLGDTVNVQIQRRDPPDGRLFITSMECYDESPTCQHCGSHLYESLGSLYCTNPGCAGRLVSRLRYFFKTIPIITDPLDQEEFISLVLENYPGGTSPNPHSSGCIVEALMALLSMEEGSGYDVYRIYLKEYLCRLNLACQNLNLSSNPPEAIILSEFILALSIPCINITHISDTLLMCQERGEVLSIFSYLADLCHERGGDDSRYYQLDLRGIEEFIMMSESYRELCSREVNLWE